MCEKFGERFNKALHSAALHTATSKSVATWKFSNNIIDKCLGPLPENVADPCVKVFENATLEEDLLPIENK